MTTQNFVTLPREDSQEAADAIHEMLMEYNNPANSHNAGRAGWRAARLYLEAALTKKQVQPAQGGIAPGFQEWWESVCEEYEVNDFKKMRRAWNAALLQSNAERVPLSDKQREWIYATCFTPKEIIDNVEGFLGITKGQ